MGILKPLVSLLVTQQMFLTANVLQVMDNMRKNCYALETAPAALHVE